MYYMCEQEMAQELLLNGGYDKRYLAKILNINVAKLNQFLSGRITIAEAGQLLPTLKKLSSRNKLLHQMKK